MTINFDDIIKAIEDGKLQKIIELRDSLDSILDDFKKVSFIEVQILNEDGDISDKIREKFPKFKCRWSCGDNDHTIGTNYVWIPSDMWNNEVKAELSKFDSFVGHHVESYVAYRLRKDIEIPTLLFNDFKYRAELRHVNVYELAVNSFELKNDFRIFDDDRRKYFEEVTIITREWDNELWVYDDREFSQRTINAFRNKVIEI